MSTSLKTYQHFTLEKAYLREDFFWAFTPTAGDFIRFRFFKPLRIERPVLGGCTGGEHRVGTECEEILLSRCPGSPFGLNSLPMPIIAPWEEGAVLCQGEGDLT